MEQVDRHTAGQPRPLRVAIVGNSNSIMRESFIRVLEASPEFIVINRSIGAVPNVLLLDFLALTEDLDFDFIVVDTAICDFVMAQTSSRSRALGIFELFVMSVQGRSSAQIILLSIPTQVSLLKPEMHWQESLYQEVAARFGLPILDGFKLVRHLVGREKMLLAKRLCMQTERLGRAFRLPVHISEALTWRALRDKNAPLNALGVFGFNDNLHFSGALHALAGELLRAFMTQAPRRAGDSPVMTATEPRLVIASELAGGTVVTRRSSIISRDLRQVLAGETARYHCPPGYRAYGILSNTAVTYCFLRMTSPAGTDTLDMHHPLRPPNWIAIIVPIVTDIGDGDIEITLVDDEQAMAGGISAPATGSIPVMAELGELILVRTDWRTLLPPPPEAPPPAQYIEEQPWAEAIIAQAAGHASSVVSSIEAQGRFIDQSCDLFVTGLLTKQDSHLSFADRARILLMHGKMTELLKFLTDACDAQPEDPELGEMLAAIRLILQEEKEGPGDLLQRARRLVQEGATKEAEAIHQEGMVRFPAEVQFWFEHAMIAFNKRDWHEATRRWQALRAKFPGHASWFRGLVASLRESGRVDEAEQVLNDLVVKFPDNADAAADHASFAVSKGDVAEALRRLRDVRQRFPDHRPNSIALIRLLAKQGSRNEAWRELSDLIRRGEAGSEVLRLAVALTVSDQEFEWLRIVWTHLAGGVSDRAEVAQVAASLVERYARTHDCSFLLEWMPDRVTQEP